MVHGLKSWESLYRWEYEQNYGLLQCDAFVAVKNTVTGKLKFYFIELDVAESGNAFDKVGKYVQVFDTEAYAGRWWVDLTDRFPPVVVVTTSPGRIKTIRELVFRENRAGLEFNLYLLDDLRKELAGK